MSGGSCQYAVCLDDSTHSLSSHPRFRSLFPPPPHAFAPLTLLSRVPSLPSLSPLRAPSLSSSPPPHLLSPLPPSSLSSPPLPRAPSPPLPSFPHTFATQRRLTATLSPTNQRAESKANRRHPRDVIVACAVNTRPSTESRALLTNPICTWFMSLSPGCSNVVLPFLHTVRTFPPY